ncbi:PAS domain-containing hybrid sensor histidine kinase/response regulator [Oligoflexus tunisiensis]|uniref:PAS domain-containing hybrid sensor histidine kinase/response regulator n=1 Tax=Oligoflexus tunisiensis TaxID=708132 RepID=UPI001C402095|nr:response regulator [Oligoflexus tunisiensis]
MNSYQPGHKEFGVTGFVEFAASEVPPVLAQSGRAGARVDRDERYMAINPAFRKLIDSTLRDDVKSSLGDVWDAVSCEQLIRPALERCGTEGVQIVQGCRLRDDPWHRTFDIYLLPESGSECILQIIHEVPAPALSDAQIEELRRLRAIVDLAPVLISIKDRYGVVRLTNRMFGVLKGPSPEAYINRSVFELFPHEVATRLWENDLAAFQAGHAVEAEETVQHADGTFHTYLTYKYPLIQSNGEVGEVCAISIDITARKYFEQQALEAIHKAEEANQVKSDFLAHMSHEIRTPLTVIRGYADLIAKKSGAEPDTIRHWSNSVVRASKQLELIINDILDLSKVEAGMIELEKKPVDLALLLHELENSFALKAQEKKLDFRVRLQGDVPRCIMMDALRFRQVLDNLVSNALKFTERGSVDVLVERGPGAQELQVWVRDTGIGLSEMEQGKLFQPFVQADGSIARKFGGTGLGLVLAKRLAQLLGGDVEIHRSAPGAGTDMRMILPIGSTAGMSCSAGSSPSGSTLSMEESQRRLQGRRLLLVEDADDIRELLRYLLVQNGALVATASLGQEALTLVARQDFDVVLMDLQMPVLDGMQTMSAMRAQGFKGSIVAVTAHALNGERERCLKAGFDEFLTKPVQLPEVLNVLERMPRARKSGSYPC